MSQSEAPHYSEECGKFRYARKRQAQEVANARVDDAKRAWKRRLKNRLRVYHCPACNGWHLTSNNANRTKRKNKALTSQEYRHGEEDQGNEAWTTQGN